MAELRGVTVRYDGAPTDAIDGLDLTIGAGERVALVGPSGAGKSTVVGLLNGLVAPTAGRVTVLGVDTSVLARRAHRPVRARIATIHQGFALVGPLRVATNVAAGRLAEMHLLAVVRMLVRPRSLDQIVAVLDRLGIADKLWDRTDRLSGGQQQRVAIARALHQEPTLLLADEPVSSLDPARSRAILDVLVDAVSDEPARALVASLHDAPLALSHSTRIVALRNGRLVFDLPTAEVTPRMLDDLYELAGS